MCSFMPAFLASKMSSAKALAVMATMGMVFPSCLWRERIAAACLFSPSVHASRRNCYGFKLLLIHCAVLETVNILRLFQPAPDIFRGKGLFQGKLTGNRLKLRRHSCHNLITWLTSLRFSCICISPLPLIYRNRSFSI